MNKEIFLKKNKFGELPLSSSHLSLIADSTL
jgi:hypothetical protein